MQPWVIAVATGALLLARAASADSIGAIPSPGLETRTFLQHCSGCHVADGSGSPSKGIPTMLGTLGRFLQTPGGREFIVQVPGVMNSGLDDRQVADLMNWLVPHFSQASVPAGTLPYTAEEVGRLRRSRPLDVFAARREVVKRAHEAGIEIDDVYATPH